MLDDQAKWTPRQTMLGGQYVTVSSEFEVKKQLTQHVLAFVERFLHTRLGLNFQKEPKPDLVAPEYVNPLTMTDHIKHLQAALDMNEEQKKELLRRFFRGTANQKIKLPVESFLIKIIAKESYLLREYVEVVKKAAKDSSFAPTQQERRKELTDFAYQLVSMYNIPDFIIARYQTDASVTNSYYFSMFLTKVKK